jgi:hypothetical protein
LAIRKMTSGVTYIQPSMRKRRPAGEIKQNHKPATQSGAANIVYLVREEGGRAPEAHVMSMDLTHEIEVNEVVLDLPDDVTPSRAWVMTRRIAPIPLTIVVS